MVALALFALVAASGAYGAIGPVSDVEIVNRHISPDGVGRSAVLAGGTFPGPLVRGWKGDTFELNVVNSLTDKAMLRSTSVHWHGILQTNSSWADGTSFVTQCPIAANDSFQYKFTVADQAGTFWYHSHLSTQYCDGLRGPMVVYDPDDPHKRRYDVDDESTIITLSDWYHTPSPSASPTSIFDSTLINGKGRYMGGPPTDLFRLTVKKGLRYRLRLIAMSCDPNWIFSIDGHTFTVIEADGVNTHPIVVNSVQIFAGQRYSLILHANQRPDNYWIRANPNFGPVGFLGGINSGILQYVESPCDDEPVSVESPSVRPLLETDLHPLENAGAPGLHYPGGADVVLNLTMGVDLATQRFTMNNVSYVPPTAPVLLQILSGASSATDLLPSGSLYLLHPNKVIEVVVPGLGNSGGPHPFHLHGHTFDVVRSVGSSVYNYDNPVRRDVVNTGGDGDQVTIRFVTDNAGPWFFHCHIDRHLEVGMGVVFVEDVDSIKATSHPSKAWDDLCPTYDALDSSQL